MPLSWVKEVLMKVFFLIMLVCVWPAAALRAAEPLEATLPPVFVTSTRTETPLSQVTASASVVTSKDIQDQQAELVLETLRRVPGLEVVQSGSNGTSASVFIRGSDSDHVLVMIDGVEV